MKKGFYLGLFIFVILSILGNLYLLSKVEALNQKLFEKSSNNKNEDFELAEKMMFLQRFSEKLFFSYKNKNWELVEFYLEELEEISEKIIQANKIEDGINVSVQMKEMLLSKIKMIQ